MAQLLVLYPPERDCAVIGEIPAAWYLPVCRITVSMAMSVSLVAPQSVGKGREFMISTKSELRAALRRGETVTIRGGGNSMVGRLNPGEDLVLVAYSRDCILNCGSIVLARVRRRWCLHQVVAIDGERLLIGDTKGYINGWTTLDQVIGVVVCVLAVPGVTPLREPSIWRHPSASEGALSCRP